METENYLFSVDGPNGIGKGGILERSRMLLEILNYLNFSHHDTIPFRTASIVEPPQLPLYAYSSHPNARMPDRSLITWRGMLKEGYGKELLSIGAPYADAREVAFAEGFLTSRAIIERYMFEEFPWTFGCELNPFINMLPNIFYGLPGGSRWHDTPFNKVVVKDRGSASTAVFQGVDQRVRTLMEQVYREGDLMMEDLTVLLLPTDRERWIQTLVSRHEDLDIHDGKFHDQADRYFNLRNEWDGVFSRNIVHLFNDPSGETNNIEMPALLLSLLLLAYRQNGRINWFDSSKQFNGVTADVNSTVALLGRVNYLPAFPKLYSTIHNGAMYEFQGILLKLVSGDIGLVSNNSYNSSYSDQQNLIIAENLSQRVNRIK